MSTLPLSGGQDIQAVSGAWAGGRPVNAEVSEASVTLEDFVEGLPRASWGQRGATLRL